MAFKLRALHWNKPGVGKVWLYFLAGLVWLGVGSMLMGFASRWLKAVSISSLLLYIIPGIALASGIYFFGFSKLAKKNIQRISRLASEKVCLFAFQGWTSYPLVAFMIGLGLYLRVYSPIPKPLLAVLYLGIGGGLFFASLHYFVNLINILKAQPAKAQR